MRWKPVQKSSIVLTPPPISTGEKRFGLEKVVVLEPHEDGNGERMFALTFRDRYEDRNHVVRVNTIEAQEMVQALTETMCFVSELDRGLTA